MANTANTEVITAMISSSDISDLLIISCAQNLDNCFLICTSSLKNTNTHTHTQTWFSFNQSHFSKVSQVKLLEARQVLRKKTLSAQNVYRPDKLPSKHWTIRSKHPEICKQNLL